MQFRLRPRDARIGVHLRAVAVDSAVASSLLAELLGADEATRLDVAHRVRQTDQAAESHMHAVLREMAAAFVTPFDRVDVFRLASALRACSARVDAAVDLIVLVGLTAQPAALAGQVQLVCRAAELTRDAVPRLTRPEVATQTWAELSRLRKQGADGHRRLLAQITAPGRDAAVLAREVAVAVGVDAVLEAFDGVGHVLQAIAVKES